MAYPPHLTLQGSDARVLLVELLLLQLDSLHQVVDAFVLRFQHRLRKQKRRGTAATVSTVFYTQESTPSNVSLRNRAQSLSGPTFVDSAWKPFVRATARVQVT